MKNILAIFACALFTCFLMSSNGQAYPYWDAGEPGYSTPYGGYGIDLAWPIVATTNAIFAINVEDYNVVVARWTKCGGWEDIGPESIDLISCGFCHSPVSLCVHDHYLYCVGSYYLAGSENPFQIVKFDLNSGEWSTVGSGYIDTVTDTNVYRFPMTVAVDSANNIYVGFEYEDGGTNLAGKTLDMLDVSTNNGSTWQPLGGGLIGATDTSEDNLPQAGITALYANGTNVYACGDFDGGTNGVLSRQLIMWKGESWFNFGGNDTGLFDGCQFYGYEFGFDSVNCLAVAGENVYVGTWSSSYQASYVPFLRDIRGFSWLRRVSAASTLREKAELLG